MPLKKLKRKPKSKVKKIPVRFKLIPTPYYKVGLVSRVDRDLVENMFFYLCQNWEKLFGKAGAKVPAYKFAEVLKIHRSSADEWLKALRDEYFVWHGVDTKLETYYPGPLSSRQTNILKSRKYILTRVKYDPWVDRKWDSSFNNMWHPYFIDEIVDDYYNLFEEEHLKHTGVRRTRPNGKLFRPLLNKRHDDDHPINFIERKELWQEKGRRPKPPPKDRKSYADKACNGQAGSPGKGKKTPQGELRSWNDFGGPPTKAIKRIPNDKPKARGTSGPRRGIRSRSSSSA